MVEQNRGSLFIVAAPSGGGKTSLVKKLVDNLDDILVSVSHTTRDQRAGEVHGEQYFFTDEAAFLALVEAGEFIEHARVFKHLYGTSKHTINKQLASGVDIYECGEVLWLVRWYPFHFVPEVSTHHVGFRWIKPRF